MHAVWFAKQNIQKRYISSALICYESLTIFCSWQAVLFTWRHKSLLSVLVTRDFHAYGNYSVCWLLSVGPLGFCITVYIHSNSITLKMEKEGNHKGQQHPQINPFKMHFESGMVTSLSFWEIAFAACKFRNKSKVQCRQVISILHFHVFGSDFINT